MTAVISGLFTTFLLVESLVMLVLDRSSVIMEQSVWLEALIDASVVAVVAAYAVPWALVKISGRIQAGLEWLKLKSALIVFGVEAILVLLIPQLFPEIDGVVAVLLNSGLFAVLATYSIYLWVLLPEQKRTLNRCLGSVPGPCYPPWLTSTCFYLFAMLLTGLIMLTLYREQKAEQLSRLGERQVASLALVQSVLAHELQNLLHDTLTLSRKVDLVKFASTREPSVRQELEQDFQGLVTTQPSYRAIRYFDRSGKLPLAVFSDVTLAGKGIIGDLGDLPLPDESLTLYPGEVRLVSVAISDLVRLIAPVFDLGGRNQGVLVVDLESDHILRLLTSSFRQLDSGLLLLTDQGTVPVVTVTVTGWGEELPLKIDPHAVQWAQQASDVSGVVELPSGLASYHVLGLAPELFARRDDFFLGGGWPDWKLLSLLPRDWIESRLQSTVQLYLMILLLIGLITGGCTAAFTRIYIRQRDAERRIYSMAHYDSLTGLDNRLLFREKLELELQHAKRDRSWLGLMYLDLDRFKPINDQYGHCVGDEALRRVVERLRPMLRASDSFARIGGDEFAVILPRISGPPELEQIADRLVSAMAPTFDLLGNDCSLGISIGIALCRGDVGIDLLIRHADSAMYEAKTEQMISYKLSIAEAI